MWLEHREPLPASDEFWNSSWLMVLVIRLIQIFVDIEQRDSYSHQGMAWPCVWCEPDTFNIIIPMLYFMIMLWWCISLIMTVTILPSVWHVIYGITDVLISVNTYHWVITKKEASQETSFPSSNAHCTVPTTTLCLHGYEHLLGLCSCLTTRLALLSQPPSPSKTPGIVTFFSFWLSMVRV